MAQETWLVVAVGAGFLLLGIAASPLGWVALLNRRTRADRATEQALGELSQQVRELRSRLERCEASLRARGEDASAGSPPGRRPASAGKGAVVRIIDAPREDLNEPTLIKVPRLAAAEARPAMPSGLTQRYAAIWELAESGASPDAIARATGQPIGQIELILGLRRQLDPARTTIPHASHE
jgi:hypothetical protein